MESPWEVSSVGRGIKRPAEDNLENEQRLTKRLSLLSIRRNDNDRAGVSHAPQQHISPAVLDEMPMQLDDTKDRVYIYNLEAELSEDESQDDKLVFIPEIDRELTKIPRSVLTSHNPPMPATSNELVLYNVPSSLSVPQEQDSVRKAIIETRARAQEQQAEQRQRVEQREPVEPQESLAEDPMSANYLAYPDTTSGVPQDVDAMDIG